MKKPVNSEIMDACCFFDEALEYLDLEFVNSCYLDVLKKFINVWDENRNADDKSIL